MDITEFMRLAKGHITHLAGGLNREYAVDREYATTFVCDIIRQRWDADCQSDWPYSDEELSPTYLATGGWLLSPTYNVGHLRNPTRHRPGTIQLPLIEDIYRAVRIVGLNIELVVAWLSCPQSWVRLLPTRVTIGPLHMTIGPDEVRRAHHTLTIFSRTWRKPIPSEFPDLASLAIIGGLTDEEIVALATDHRPCEFRDRKSHWFPDLESLEIYWAAPESQRIHRKLPGALTEEEKGLRRDALDQIFPGLRGAAFLQRPLARGVVPKHLLPQLTRRERHEFIYSDWSHLAGGRSYMPSPFNFLLFKFGLHELGYRGPVSGIPALRWVHFHISRGAWGDFTKLRTFTLPGGIRYMGSYANRLDEVLATDINLISDTVQTVFRRIDARMTAAAALESLDLDDMIEDLPEWCDNLPDGFRALNTKRSLQIEGREMEHCVSGYVGQIQQNGSIILSMRDDADSTRSTVEINRDTLEVVQHRAVRNADPLPAHVNRLQNLMERVRALVPTEEV